jgi:hypothetical protein
MTIYSTRPTITTDYSSRTDKWYLLNEDWSYLLLEDWGKILLEFSYNIETQYTTRPVIS